MDSRINTESSCIREDVVKSLMDAIEELPPDWRIVFQRQAIDGETFRSIAEETGISINTLLIRKHRAVQFLRHRLRSIRDLIN